MKMQSALLPLPYSTTLEPPLAPIVGAFERQPELMNEVLRVDDSTWYHERVHLLLEELVAFEQMAKVWERPSWSARVSAERRERLNSPKNGSPSDRATSSWRCRSW